MSPFLVFICCHVDQHAGYHYDARQRKKNYEWGHQGKVYEHYQAKEACEDRQRGENFCYDVVLSICHVVSSLVDD